MKVSDQGLLEIMSHEAVVLSPYQDSVGVWTYGVGHTKSAGAPNPDKMEKGADTSIGEAVATFKRDISKYEKRVNDAVTETVSQTEFDALVSFDFNTGGIYKAFLTGSLNAGNHIAAGQQFMGWVKPPEIIERRKKEQKLFMEGVYSNDGKISVYPADKRGRVNWSRGKRLAVGTFDLSPDQPEPPEKSPVAKVYKITKAQVSEWQANNGLTADGTIGPNTWAKLTK